jgi:hypothetical protein
MPIVSLPFAALVLTAILLGGMVWFSAVFAPLVVARLPAEVAGPFIRTVFPFYYGIGAALALGASALVAWSLAGLALALTGVVFLFALLWLMPAINRWRDKGTAGDAAAMAVFANLHRASVVLNGLQLVAVLVALALIASGHPQAGAAGRESIG